MGENDYYDSLLEDPVEETPTEESEAVVEEPILPDQDSDAKPDEEPTNEPPQQEDDLLTSYLKGYGIEDPAKIQFENENGEIEEVDFRSLPKEEQLTILNELSNSVYSDYERSVINYLRQNNTDLQGVIDYFSNKAIEDYLAKNPDAAPQKSYKIDDYSDDELYIADLATKYPDFSEEELNAKLDAAKVNDELFKKEVDALRAYYKQEETRQEEAAKQEEQLQYENLQNTLLNTVKNFNEIVLDQDDPNSDSLEIEDSDREQMMSYLLDLDKDGVSQFEKDLNDPAALIELAWLRTQGRNTLTGITQYWKKELADTRKELTKVKKELERYTKKETNSEVKPTPKRDRANKVSDLWI